jgi:phage-related protein
VHDFIAGLPTGDRAAVVAAMREVREEGTRFARHLRRDIYEVRADGDKASYRLLFASEGAKGRVLLALVAFKKQTQRTPARVLELATRRLADWRKRPAAE